MAPVPEFHNSSRRVDGYEEYCFVFHPDKELFLWKYVEVMENRFTSKSVSESEHPTDGANQSTTPSIFTMVYHVFGFLEPCHPQNLSTSITCSTCAKGRQLDRHELLT